VYNGPARDALARFTSLGYDCPATFNPADFIIDIVSTTQFTDSFCKTTYQPYVATTINNSMLGSKKQEELSEYASSFWIQLTVLMQRTLLNLYRNPFVLKVQYPMTVVVALLLGYLYWHLPNDLAHGGMQNRMGALFFMLTLLCFSAITSIDIFYSERLLFLRERANGCYRTSAYFMAKAISDIIPLRVIPPLILGGIVYRMMGLVEGGNHVLIFLGTLILASVTASAMCFVISAVTPTVSVGNLIAILLMLFFLLFGGFIVEVTNMPDFIRWVTNLSFFTYGYTVLMINEFKDINITINVQGYDPTVVPGTVILDEVGMNPNSLQIDIVLLGVLAAIYFFAAYVLLRFIVKEKR
jgi:ABC-type multidrug transport system permease subunit